MTNDPPARPDPAGMEDLVRAYGEACRAMGRAEEQGALGRTAVDAAVAFALVQHALTPAPPPISPAPDPAGEIARVMGLVDGYMADCLRYVRRLHAGDHGRLVDIRTETRQEIEDAITALARRAAP